MQMYSYRWCGSVPSTPTTATTMIRRLCCLQSVSSASTTTTTNKKPLVFLGAPQVSLSLHSSFFTFFCFTSFSTFQVSSIVLDTLLDASASPHSSFEVPSHPIYTPFSSNFTFIPCLHCVWNMNSSGCGHCDSASC